MAAVTEMTMYRAARHTGGGTDATPVTGAARPPGRSKAGQTAPAFSLPDEEGRAVSLAAPSRKGRSSWPFSAGVTGKKPKPNSMRPRTGRLPAGGRVKHCWRSRPTIFSRPRTPFSSFCAIQVPSSPSQYGLGRSAAGGCRSASFVIDQTGMTVLSLMDADRGRSRTAPTAFHAGIAPIASRHHPSIVGSA